MAEHNVLSTKKLAPSLTELAKAEGIKVLEQEAILVKPILTKEKWDEIFSLLEKRIKYAVFTSSNAVTALKKYVSEYVNYLPPQWKIFCLSGKTKDVLQENEELFGTIEATASSAAELAKLVIAKNVKELLFFCGDRRREELPAILHKAGVKVHEVVIYEVEETPAVAPDDYEAILFFSPSAVQSFFSANQLKENVVCFAIGQTTATSLQQFTTSKLCVSKEPTQEALIKEVINHFKTR
jgi:uroporphyrinogen-III synthase